MSALRYSIFFAGDTGEINPEQRHPVLDALKVRLAEAGEDSCLLLLGDNAYPRGLPDPASPDYNNAAEVLSRHTELAKSAPGKVYFLSGNHDWNKGQKGGYKSLLRQQHFLQNAVGKKDIMVPEDGCPGPFHTQLLPEVDLIVLNSQWWVQRGMVPAGEKYGCSHADDSEVFEKLERLLSAPGRIKIVAAHHPIYSYALHGGYFHWKHHIFPFAELNKRLLLPFPVAGSLYPLFRRHFGSRTDMSHKLYKRYRKKLLRSFRNRENIIFASGHDHNLQYIKKGENHFLVSGAGSKVTYVRRGAGSKYAAARKGFFRVNIFDSGSVDLEGWSVKDSGEAVLRYSSVLFRKEELKS